MRAGPLAGALLEGVARHTAGGWGARIALGGAGWSDREVGAGRVSWTRLTGGAGLIHGWAGQRFFLDLREQFLAAALVATGHGYDQSRTQAVFDPGLDLGIRAGALVRPMLRLWIDAGVTLWPVTQELRVEGFDQTVHAPHWTGSLSLGGTFLSTR